MHFHVCVVDGVFEALPDVQSDSDSDSDSDLAESANAASITFHPAQIDDAAIAAVHANVRKRLLRYCARPPFALDRLKQRGADLVYRCGKGHAEPLPSSKYAGELVLTPTGANQPHRPARAASQTQATPTIALPVGRADRAYR
ncbi:hypothetical protein M2244_004057 [Rhodoferax antarcticus]|nr:hypothetical protein [Rhodoferax antarcticus]MCW2314292.1 hypothetical protein [Rhodoferax antarcticus]